MFLKPDRPVTAAPTAELDFSEPFLPFAAINARACSPLVLKGIYHYGNMFWFSGDLANGGFAQMHNTMQMSKEGFRQPLEQSGVWSRIPSRATWVRAWYTPHSTLHLLDCTFWLQLPSPLGVVEEIMTVLPMCLPEIVVSANELSSEVEWNIVLFVCEAEIRDMCVIVLPCFGRLYYSRWSINICRPLFIKMMRAHFCLATLCLA